MADIWKENVMEEMESGKVEYESAEEFLTSLKKEFGGGEEESIKVVELRKLEQGGRMMEEFVQEFKRATRNREDKCDSSKECRTGCGGSSKTGPLCDGGGQGKELFCLQGIWAYGLSLQKSGSKRQGGGQ